MVHIIHWNLLWNLYILCFLFLLAYTIYKVNQKFNIITDLLAEELQKKCVKNKLKKHKKNMCKV
jgi:hypothetical protein